MGPERRRNAMRKQHSERGSVDTCLAAIETLNFGVWKSYLKRVFTSMRRSFLVANHIAKAIVANHTAKAKKPFTVLLVKS